MSERMYQVIIGVLVLIILVGGAFVIGGKRTSINAGLGQDSSTSSDEAVVTDESDSVSPAMTEKSTAKPGSPAPTPKATANGDAVSVFDQVAGKSVTVQSVTVSKPTWIAIRRSNDWTIGVQLVQPGTHEHVVVSLVKSTVKGEKYTAVLMVDNGDGSFSLHKESLIMNSDGSALSSAFLAK